VAISAARCPDHDDHSAPQKTDCDQANFAIVPPVILLLIHTTREYLGRVLEIEPTLPQRLVALCGIVGDRHAVFNVYTLNREGQDLARPRPRVAAAVSITSSAPATAQHMIGAQRRTGASAGWLKAPLALVAMRANVASASAE